MTYDHQQLMALWNSVGGAQSKADLAAAIAQAESSGDPTVTSQNTDGGTNVGLWQLDTKGAGAGLTVAELKNPTTNAAQAVRASLDGTSWGQWQSYTTGAYKQYLGDQAALPSASQVPPVTSNPTGLAAIGSFFSTLGQANLWIRIGEVLLGLILLSVGFARITGTTPAIEKIATKLPGVIPV